eukprot:320949-Pleurochrysis_carterae.AAC.1
MRTHRKKGRAWLRRGGGAEHGGRTSWLRGTQRRWCAVRREHASRRESGCAHRQSMHSAAASWQFSPRSRTESMHFESK